MQSYSYDEAHSGYGDSRPLKSSAVLYRFDAAVPELFQASQYQVFSNAGVSARGFTWPNDSLGANVHSADFTRMDTARVVPAWSWGSPSENFFSIIGNDGHAVSGFDFIDTIPSDSEFLDGVRNGYALIEDRNFGFVDNQINNSAEKSGPHEGDNVTSQGTGKPGLNIQGQNQQKNYAGTNGAGFGSDNLGVADATHNYHDYMVSYESGDFRG